MANLPVHIDLSREKREWAEAIYGREVRQANINAFTKIEETVNITVDSVIGAVDSINRTAENAQAAIDAANGATATAEKTMQEAAEAVGKAETARTESEEWARTAESWAVGGTGTRDGENADNSRYYSGISGEHADRACTEADRAARYASIVAPGFYVDEDTMTLYMKSGVGIDFTVADGNVLCWRIA